MADLPITRKKAGIEVQLGLTPEKGLMALKPDLCEERHKRITDALPEGTYVGFRFSQSGPRFSVLELILTAEETEDRKAELTRMADEVEEAWPDKWGRFAVAPEVHHIDDPSQIDQTFFQGTDAEAAVEAST